MTDENIKAFGLDLAERKENSFLFPWWTRRNTILLLTHVQLMFTTTFIFYFLLTLDSSCHMSVYDKYLFTLQNTTISKPVTTQIFWAQCWVQQHTVPWKGHNTSKVKQYLQKQIILNLAASVNYDWYDWINACPVLSQIPVGSIAM